MVKSVAEAFIINRLRREGSSELMLECKGGPMRVTVVEPLLFFWPSEVLVSCLSTLVLF